MAYRPFKRVLGDTSLERKCRLLFGLCLLVLITVSFFFYGQQTEDLVYRQNPTRGRLLVYSLLNFVHWEKLERYEEFKPVIRELGASWQADKLNSSFIRPDKIADGSQPVDEFEREFLSRASQGPPAVDPKAGDDPERSIVYDNRVGDGNQTYEYYQAIYVSTSCVDCHRALTGPADLKEGDLFAVAKVQISNAPIRTQLNLNRAFLLSAAIATVFMAMVASWLIIRFVIVKPLKHLRNVSDDVSRGNITERADIQTGDEFEDLATSFNRMLRHLVDAQQELQKSNSTLDAKVDELAQANMRLFELNRMKSDFLATMSHELRTPLNSIIGFSEVLGSIDSLDDKQKRYVQNIQKSGKVLLDMINDILDLAKIESGKMELRLSEFPLEHVVHAQCDSVRPLTEKKNIDLIVETAPCDGPLYQDQNKFQQILNNLLSNAIKFTPEGGRIRVSSRCNEQEQVELVVADTGVGISEEDQEAIFEKFRQGKSVLAGGDAMTREHTGTGLGLSIVRELCRLLGGEITLESELGKGSEFTVRLPWRFRKPRTAPELGDSLDGLALSNLADADREQGIGRSVAPTPSLGIGDP